MGGKYILEATGIDKAFSGVTVLKGAELCIEPGELHALMGENGAGKSTLMKIIMGIYTKDAGKVVLDGKEVEFKSAREALDAGISMIHQELSPIPEMTVAENVFLGREQKKIKGLPFVDKKQLNQKTQELLVEYELDQYIKPTMKMKNLNIAQIQMMEIIKAVSYNSKVIIMDEPTVAVDPQSRNKILEGIQKLNEQGSTIIYTSHYMEEVEQICTRIAIMDHGRVIASGTTEELKKMIKTGETITVEAILLEEKHLQDIRNLSNVFDVHYENQILSLRCTGAQHNLIRLLNYLQSQDITFGRVFSELPTLNDVFLEITGKQLRD